MSSTVEQLIRLVGTLGLVVGGALVAGRLLRRTQGLPGAPLRVLGRLSLGKGGALLLVAVEGRRFLIGTSERGPRLLAELEGAAPHPAAEERPADGARTRAAPGPAFAELGLTDQDGPGTGLVEQLRRMTLRTSGRSRVAVR